MRKTTRTHKIIITLSVLILTGTLLFIFWPSIAITFSQLQTNGFASREDTNHLEAPKGNTADPNAKKITRKKSYLGRIREAKKLIENEYYTIATLELLNAMKQKPDFTEPYLLLGEVYLRTNDINKLKNLIFELNTRFPGNEKVAALEARKLILEGKYAEVLSFLDKSKDHLTPELQFYQALLKALQNDHAQTKRILSDLKNLRVNQKKLVIKKFSDDPKEANAANFITPEQVKKVTAILNVYENFETLEDGRSPHLFALISKALAAHTETKLSREFADIAIKEDPKYIDAWILRGYANLLLKNNEEALKDLRYAYELDPIRPQTHYFLALALLEAGKDAEAVLFFERSLEHQFEFTNEIRWKLVEIFSKQKKYERVLELYKELLDSDVEEQKFTTAMHQMISLIKSPRTALEVTKTLTEKEPQNVFMLNMYAWALIANKQYIVAEEILKKAENLNSQYPRTYLNFGVLYEAQEEFEKAITAFQKSHQLGKGSTQDQVVNLAAEKYNELNKRVHEMKLKSKRLKHAP